MRKILFLDIDGVLNSETLYDRGGDSLYALDHVAIARVKAAVTATGAEIVLSSTWRLLPQAIDTLRAAGLVIADVTPSLRTNHRGEEIHAWLQAHSGEVAQFAILDDDADAGDGFGLAPRFVQTTWRHGMLDDHRDAVIALLE